MAARAPSRTSPARAGGGLGCACATVRRAARLVTKLYDQRLRDADIEAPQYALLTTLLLQGPCSQAMLARPHALDKTTVSRNLRLLERKGWIANVATADRRERQVTLTAEGRRRRAQAEAGWKAAQAELRAAMSSDEWAAIFTSFAALARAADTALAGSGRRR